MYVKQIATTVALILSGCGSVQASPLSEQLDQLLQQHNLMASAQQNLSAAQARVDVEKSGWYPTFTLSGDYGRDNYDRSNADDSALQTDSLSLSAKQLVWDFGTLNATIQKTEQGVIQARAEVDRQRQHLILAGLEAELNLRKAITVLEYAQQSEANIKQQTQLENTRIQSGQGYTTDLLQAKSQLAAAEARRVAGEAALAQAVHRYQSIFNSEATAPKGSAVTIQSSQLPKDLQQALEWAGQNNPSLKVSAAQQAVADADLRRTRKAEWMPTLHLVAKHSDEDNPDGSEMERTQNNIGLQFNWSFDAGQRASHAIQVAAHTAASIEQEYLNSRKQVTEDTRNAWNQLHSATERATHLNNQAEIVSRFLELARKERELGKRSLLDVLNGETSLINARSDAAAAETEVKLAQLRLLLQVGQLNTSLFQ
jgi:TolC family type I secretion outer membrane protein